jgi:hypothetical protein
VQESHRSSDGPRNGPLGRDCSFTNFCGHQIQPSQIRPRAVTAAGNPLRGFHKISIMKKTILTLGVIASLAGSAQAALLLSINQVGADVVTTGSGSVNLSGLGSPTSTTGASFLQPKSGWFLVGTTRPLAWYSTSVGVSGPANFGTGDMAIPTSDSGETFGVQATSSSIDLYLPVGYVSGTALSGTTTYTSTTLTDLGVTPGTYTWTWGSGSTADSVTMTIVPEPHQYAMAAGLGLVGIGLWRRHARK